MENNKVQFTTSQMLKWMEYVADLKEVSPEKIKMLNTCGKRRNILATIATHKMILIFADETHSNMLYKCWEAGYGDYEMYKNKIYIFIFTKDFIMKKKDLALEVIKRLEKEYPDADCTLDYNDAWKLLISVRLAAQCTDERVNKIVPALYEKYPTIEAVADAPVEEIEKIVRPCGLGKSKARDISLCMKMLKDEFDCKVPDNMKDLLKLPGVGRKSANLIMGDVFGEPAIVTDTHCIRLCNRIGLVNGIKEPKKVEMELWKIIPPEKGSDFCHRLVYHGREVCTARTTPHCERCCLEDICKKNI